jgi:hypothetical protein
MNCEKFKEAVAANTQATFDGGAQHVAECESCASFMADMQALDSRIAGALAIDVPELNIPDLPAIEEDNVVNLPFERKGGISTPAWIGIAASLAVAVFIGFQMTGTGPGDEYSLANEILAHIDHEPGALRVTNVAVSDERFGRVVNSSVGTMDRDVGLITYAQSCVINGKTIPHLVIQGEKGPVTLLLLPDEMVDGAQKITGESVDGIILPVGSGSVAIIGERDEVLGEIEQRVIDSVEWSI